MIQHYSINWLLMKVINELIIIMIMAIIMSFENAKKPVTFTNSAKPTGQFGRFLSSIVCK